MSGRLQSVRLRGWTISSARTFLALLCVACFASSPHAQERREREPNSVYAARRAKLAAQVDAPIVLWGFTGREEISADLRFCPGRQFLLPHRPQRGRRRPDYSSRGAEEASVA